MRNYDQPSTYEKQTDYFDEGYQNNQQTQERYPTRRQQRSTANIESSTKYDLMEETVPYPTRTGNQSSQSEYRRNQLENERNKRGIYNKNDENSRENTAERSYNQRTPLPRVNESSIVFGGSAEISGRSPPSRLKGKSPERDDIPAGRPTKMSSEEKKHGIRSEGFGQKSTSNLLTWDGMNPEETKSRGSSVERKMLTESVNYSRKGDVKGKITYF